jgi:hypothetical protein
MNTNYSRQNQNARCRLMMMLVVAACLPFTAHLGAPERLDPMAATVDQWFTMIEESFIGLAEAMPAEKYGFKPTDGEFKEARTFGEQVKHVACANFGFFNEIEKKEPPADCANGGPSPAATKAELMAYLRESFEYAQKVLRRRAIWRRVHAPGADDARSLARLGPLRPACRVPSPEWDRAAGQPAGAVTMRNVNSSPAS